MTRYEVQATYPARKGRKPAKYHLHTPPMASRDHALWWAACSAAYDGKPDTAHIVAMPVSVEVTQIPE